MAKLLGTRCVWRARSALFWPERNPRRPSRLSTYLLSNHSRDLHSLVEASLFRGPGERQRRRPEQETGPEAKGRVPGGVASVGSCRAPPVAVFEHSTEKAALGTDFCSQPHWAGQGHLRREARNHPEPVPQSSGPPSCCRGACVPSRDPSRLICLFALSLRPCVCPKPVPTSEPWLFWWIEALGRTLSLIRNTDPPGEAPKTENSPYPSHHSLESNAPRNPDLDVKLTRRFSLDPRPFFSSRGVQVLGSLP